MKNVYIMGAGQFGKYIYNQLLEYKEDWRVLGYIDSDISKKDTQEAGVRIYHLWESDINDIDDNTVVFIAITRAGDKLRLVHRLIHLGFCNIFEVHNSVFINKESILSESGLLSNAVKKYKTGLDNRVLPVFRYMETHVMNGCNLRCKGCSHFSNLFEPDDMVEFDEFKKDIYRLSEVCNILVFRLLGGEPLLNKNLIAYLSVVKEAFADTDVHIATNGLLITKCSDALLRYISDNRIVLDITMYSPSFAMKEEIAKRLNDYKILYDFGKENLSEFNKVLTLHGENDPEVSVNACERKQCLILKAGNLYRCPISAYVEKYNERYGTNIDSEILFNIYSGSQDRLWEIALEDPVKPVSTCRYCVNKPVSFSWEQSLHPEKEEWLV